MTQSSSTKGLILSQTSQDRGDDRFRLFIERVKDYAMFVLDPDGTVASWNSGAHSIYGYTAKEIIGQHFSVFYPAEAKARGWPDYELQMAQSQGRFEDEGWRLRKNGAPFWSNVLFTTLYDHTTELRGYAVVMRDLSEQKRIEELEEKIRHMSEFLAVLGHELRNPLAPIRNAMSILEAHCAGQPNEERIIWCKNLVERQVTQLTRLVDELLDVGRITSGKVLLNKAEIDLRTVIAQAVESVMPRINECRQQLTVDLPAQPIWVHGDISRLVQVVQNLLHNASKFTPEEVGKLHISATQKDGQALLTVRDNGVGIAPMSLPRIFDIFVQEEQSVLRSQGGLGIGLALVKELVGLHGGTVEAASPGIGEGSRFTICLPALVKPSEKTASGQAVSRPRPIVPLRILVVDDNKDTAESSQLLLQTAGHKVRIAHDGPAALSAAAEFTPHAVLLDLGLPKVTGYEIAQQLRKLPLPHPLLIAVTGYGQAEDRRRTHLAGFDEHLVKPVSINTLTRVLARIRRTSQPLPVFTA